MDAIVPMLQAAAVPGYYSVLALGIIAGSVAVVSPEFFRRVCERGGQWVATPLEITALDKQAVDTDRFLLQRCRLTGVGILGLVAVFATTVSFSG
ncbi:MAG: hypothetical protein ACR2NM_16040 [Bythopirellula sp.]